MFPGEMLVCHRGCSKKMLVLAREIFYFPLAGTRLPRDKKKRLCALGTLPGTRSTLGWCSGEMLGFPREMPVCCMEKPGYHRDVLVCLREVLLHLPGAPSNISWEIQHVSGQPKRLLSVIPRKPRFPFVVQACPRGTSGSSQLTQEPTCSTLEYSWGNQGDPLRFQPSS